MTKKYEFTGETKEHNGYTLHRIRRLSDGLVGGWAVSKSRPQWILRLRLLGPVQPCTDVLLS